MQALSDKKAEGSIRLIRLELRSSVCSDINPSSDPDLISVRRLKLRSRSVQDSRSENTPFGTSAMLFIRIEIFVVSGEMSLGTSVKLACSLMYLRLTVFRLAWILLESAGIPRGMSVKLASTLLYFSGTMIDSQYPW